MIDFELLIEGINPVTEWTAELIVAAAHDGSAIDPILVSGSGVICPDCGTSRGQRSRPGQPCQIGNCTKAPLKLLIEFDGQDIATQDLIIAANKRQRNKERDAKFYQEAFFVTCPSLAPSGRVVLADSPLDARSVIWRTHGRNIQVRGVGLFDRLVETMDIMAKAREDNKRDCEIFPLSSNGAK